VKSAPTIAFDYRPSRWISAASGLVVVLAAMAPWLSSLPAIACAAVSLAVLATGIRALRRHLRPRFIRVAWRASGWSLVDRAADEHAALLVSQAHLGALLALGFRDGPRSHFRIVLAPDNLDLQTRRRLILLLARAEVARAE
jgi:hypothetical protein